MVSSFMPHFFYFKNELVSTQTLLIIVSNVCVNSDHSHLSLKNSHEFQEETQPELDARAGKRKRQPLKWLGWHGLASGR